MLACFPDAVKKLHLGKINMEPQNRCLEDAFPFQFGGFLGSMFIFQFF